MIEQTGTVIALKNEGRIAAVQCREQSACAGCPSTQLCRGGQPGEKTLEVINEAGAKIHDQVRIVTSTGHFLKASFVLYIVPVIGLLAGAIFGQQLAEMISLPIDSALITALAGAGGLLLALLLIHRTTQQLQREKYMPRIISIVNCVENLSPEEEMV